MRGYEALGENFRLDLFAADTLASIERADTLHQSLLEGTADGHHLADRLHLRAEVFVSSGEFLELPLGNFDHDVVERRLEAGRRLAGNIVRNLVERVTDGELRGNFCNRKSRRLRS